ncbi:MAG: ABC transporter ATP-binding protein [Deltaproteobacteria bacterium]|nr:ABC transporter ATP-binding protein [Deltaproteobacteria bacterium]
MSAAPLLEADDVCVRFALRGRALAAVDHVSLTIDDGETLGLVGESGSGKSTLGRALLRLVPLAAGRVRFEDQELTALDERALRPLRRRMQMVFQDASAALNPRMTVLDLVAEGLDIHGLARGAERGERVRALLAQVGVDDAVLGAYPHELSGGQRQRVGIARALAVEPRFLVCDEPTSALDASVRAQVLNQLADLRDARKLTMLFITHDLGVVRHVAGRVAVMYLGRVVEEAPTEVLFTDARHPYTRALLASAPVPDPSKRRAFVPPKGEMASALDPPSGCAFHPRCPDVVDRCRTEVPQLVRIGARSVACHVHTAT